MPQPTAVVRAQDDQGFLWIASKGLTKYDGYTFKTFLFDPEDDQSISSNYITNTRNSIIYSEFKGKKELWICSSKTLDRFDLETEKFTRYIYVPQDSREHWIYNVYEDKQGTLWVRISGGGLFTVDRETHVFTKHGGANWLYEDNGDTLWVCTSSRKIKYFDRNQNQFIAPDIADSSLCKICETGSKEIMRDSFGIYWGTLSRVGLFAYDPQTKVLSHYQHEPNNPNSLTNNIVYGIYEDEQGVLWMNCRRAGMISYDRHSNSFTRHSYNLANLTGISSRNLRGIFVDRSGIFWNGSDNGLNKWNRQQEQFNLIQHDPQNPNGLNSDKINCIYQHSSGTIWIGTYEGLNKYNPTTNTFTFYRHSDNGNSNLSQDFIKSICEDGSGFIWVATLNNIHKIDPQSGKIVLRNSFPPPPRQARQSNIAYLTSDRHGNIWVGARWNLHKVDPETGHYIGEYLTSGSVPDPIYEDSKGILWIGSLRNGLIRFDPLAETWTTPVFTDNGEPGLSSNRVTAICEDHKGILWVGTDSGLNQLTPQGDKGQLYHCTSFRIAEGLPSDGIQGILEDNNGQLWITTSNGLSKYNPNTRQFRNYDENDGLADYTFSNHALLKTPDGELFLGGMNGITSFHPDSLKDNLHIPPIVLTDFQLFHETVPIDPELYKSDDAGYTLPKHISRLDSIKLSYRENIFSIEFAALDYRNPMRNQYAYMLEGFNEDWIYTDASNRKATYTNLDPGDYVFRVKGSNNDGLWNDEGVSLTITITPPWWQTRVAYLGYFLLVMATFTLFYRIRLARVRLQYQAEMDHLEAERYHEMDELKSRFFANISHEFRTPLTLILGPVGKMLTKLKGGEWDQDLNLMQRQAKRLLELVTQLLDLSKLESGRMKIQASQRNIIPLLKGLVLSFASLAERERISLSFTTELEDLQAFVEKDAMAKIINNLLTNAFKVTESGGNIQVNVTTNNESDFSSEGEIYIAITDNGIGIPAERVDKIFDRFYQVDNSETREREGTGIGLALTRELVELHKGSIGVTSEEGAGTTFTICLPLGKAHLSTEDIVETEEDHIDDSLVDQIAVEESIPLTQTTGDESLPILLIVEDNADVRSYIRSYLDEQYSCYEAVDGEDGLEQALELIPDLIISDVMMPKIDGVEFCRRIKSDVHTSHIPVILLTAKADLESKLAGLETGADEYLTKPFEAEELLVRIKNLIEQRELLRKRFQQDLNLIPEDLNLSSIDEQFLEKALKIISEHMTDFEFNVDQFSQKIFMSRQHLNRKLKSISGRTAVEFIRSIRLKRAAQLLSNHNATVTEIAYQVGFSSLSFFSKSFQEEFGKTPSAYIAEQKVDD